MGNKDNQKSLAEYEIAERNSHYFVYGKNTVEREKFLKEIVEKHPFKFDSDERCVIYIDDLGLPNVPKKAENLESWAILRDAREYLEFTIAQQILKRVNEATPRNEEKIKELLKDISMSEKREFETLDEVIECMQKSKEFYATDYKEYLTKGTNEFARDNYEKLDIPCIFDLSRQVSDIQNKTGNKSAFQLILDRKVKIPKVSVMAINTILNMRCNGELSAKVVCEPDEWETMTDLNGSFPEVTHDYSICELDDTYKEFLKRKRKEFEEKWYEAERD